jgi:hypothetical protein
VLLLNCDNCGNQVTFEFETIPMYSLTTPPVKGMEVKVIFGETIRNSSEYTKIFAFSLLPPNNQARLLQGFNTLESSRFLQGLI